MKLTTTIMNDVQAILTRRGLPQSLEQLQSTLRQLDANGYLTLTDEEQNDPAVLSEAIRSIESLA